MPEIILESFWEGDILSTVSRFTNHIKRYFKRSNMKLDVGCGHDFKGDVNLDLNINATLHRHLTNQNDFPLQTRLIPNFIKADCCCLPFQDKCFEEVYSSHVIEHIANPFLMLKEMARVSKSKITIKCPHRYAGKKSPGHISMLNLTWFMRAFARIGLTAINGKAISWRYFPHSWFPLFRLPIEIEVVGWKKWGQPIARIFLIEILCKNSASFDGIVLGSFDRGC